MNKEAFFDAIRANPFGGSLSQSAVDGIEAILSAWETYGDGDANKLAYILGTAFHESDRFKTMEEYASGAAYEGRADLGNTEPGDGVRFKGRGFVQITGRRNYQDWSGRLATDLMAQPQRASESAIAARIIVQGMMRGTFTRQALGKYIGGGQVDYFNARRVVNGTDRADLIAKYAKAFQDAIQSAAEPASAPEPPPAPLPAGETPIASEPTLAEQVADLKESLARAWTAINSLQRAR